MKRVVSQRETLTALPVWGRKYWNINIRFYISFSLLKELKRRAQKAVDALNNDQHKHICLWKWRESPRGSSLPSPPAGDQSDQFLHETEIPRHRHQCDFRLKTVCGKSLHILCVGRGCVCWSNSHPGGALLLCVCLRGGVRTSGS